MTSENRGRRRRYILLLILLSIPLLFGVINIVRRVSAAEQPPLPTAEATEPATLAAPTEPVTDTTDETPDPSAEPETDAPTEETEAPTEETTAPTEETEASTDEAIAANTSPSGNIVCNKSFLYVRINHSQKLILRLSGGLKQSDVQWSTDDDSVVDVDAGVVTGLQKGSCIVTASCGEDAVRIPVTVREMTVENDITYVDGMLVVNKSYSLPREYDPGLLPITEEAFEALSEDAAKEGLDIHIGSDYRSYDFQEKVYNSMVSGYSKEYADAVSARPGHSEHQSGYTIDCNTIDNNFADTPAGKWLAAHAHEYGFIIRYPKGKESITGYAYESWHIRYVGIEHATKIYEQNLTLEEYLDVISVYDEEDTEADMTPRT